MKDRGLGAIKVDEREGAEAGAAGGVGRFDVGNFCGIAGCRLAGPIGNIKAISKLKVVFLRGKRECTTRLQIVKKPR